MGSFVDLDEWRRRHPRSGTGACGCTRPGLGERDREGLDRLDLAVQRLSPLVDRALEVGGRMEPRVETELLAIIGELTVGLIGEAAGRAERLAQRLGG
jgi:hypothetical protein